MGHSSITVTPDRYGHLFPELDEAIASAFDEQWHVHRAATRASWRSGDQTSRYEATVPFLTAIGVG
jgi:hypothetical protein